MAGKRVFLSMNDSKTHLNACLANRYYVNKAPDLGRIYQ